MKFTGTFNQKLFLYDCTIKECKRYQSDITIEKGNKAASAKKLMALMSLGVSQGDAITVVVEGPDEDTAASQLESFFQSNF